MWSVLQGANPGRIRTRMLWFYVLKWHGVCRGSVLLERVNIILKPQPPFFSLSLCYLWLVAVKSLFSALLSPRKRCLGFTSEPSQHLIIFIRSFSGLPSGLHKALASLIDSTNGMLLFSSEEPFAVYCHCLESPWKRNFWKLKQRLLQLLDLPTRLKRGPLRAYRAGWTVTWLKSWGKFIFTKGLICSAWVTWVTIEHTWSVSTSKVWNTSSQLVCVCATFRASTWQQNYPEYFHGKPLFGD